MNSLTARSLIAATIALGLALAAPAAAGKGPGAMPLPYGVDASKAQSLILIQGKVTLVESTYMPSNVAFQLDTAGQRGDAR